MSERRERAEGVAARNWFNRRFGVDESTPVAASNGGVVQRSDASQATEMPIDDHQGGVMGFICRSDKPSPLQPYTFDAEARRTGR